MDDDMPSIDDLFDEFDSGVQHKKETSGSETSADAATPSSPPAPDSEPESETAADAPATESEYMGQAGLQVTGQARLEAAFGSGDGDELVSAQVAQVAQSTSGGTIFHQIYRPWRGELNPRWMRNWAILRHHIYGLFSKGHRPYPLMTKLVIFGVFISSLADLGFMALGSITGAEEIERMFGISRGNLYGHVLAFWFRNACYYPIVTALLIGGIISEDRQHGTSALYFSRPINRRDYAMMKFLSVGIILGVIIIFSLCMYYLGGILVNGEGWSYLIDTSGMFLAALAAAFLLVFTYTSIGLALSSVSQGKFFPAVAFLISTLFDRSAIYLISPYDNLAHVGQWMIGVNHTYDHPAVWSLVMLLVMNAISLYVLSARVSSLEVTRE